MHTRRNKRVYIRHKGRLTKGQARAIENRADHYRLPSGSLENLASCLDSFPRPIMLEIGFGMGHALVGFAAAHETWTCIGVDLYQPGIGSLILQCDSLMLNNVRFLEIDARDVLPVFPAESVRLATIYFPDPWPKARHHKRRLIQAPLVSQIARALEHGGRLLLATDFQPYAEAMIDVLDAEPILENEAGRGAFFRGPATRPVTRFERRGLSQGNVIWDLAYRKI